MIAGYCTACGAGYETGQGFCGRCGKPIAPTPPAESDTLASQPPPSDDPPYPAGATVGAVLLTIFMPFIALIAALVLRSSESRRTRREFLKNWAIASGAWLATGWLIAIIAFASIGSSVSGCKGGIDYSVPPSYYSNDNVHWTATYTCMNGGTITKSVPSSQVPGG